MSTAEKVLVNKADLQRAIEYVNSVLEALDVDDPTEFNEGYDAFIKPIEELAFAPNSNFDEFVIAKQVDFETFKENLNGIYDVNIEEISDEEIKEIFDEVEEMLAGDDEYSEIYNDAVWGILKEHNIG